MGSVQTSTKRYDMLIDGEFVTNSRLIPVINPATEEVISEVPDATEQDVNAAVQPRSERSFPGAGCPRSGEQPICMKLPMRFAPGGIFWPV